MLIVLAVILFLGITPEVVGNEQVLRASLVSRLDFSPAILEVIRKELAAKQDATVTIAYQPSENLSAEPEFETNALLVESGFPTALIPPGFNRTDICIHLCWGLLVSRSLADQVPDQLTIKEFMTLLESAKTKLNLPFPWFEPLTDNSTAFNYLTIFNTSKGTDSQQLASATALLLLALEKGLLNPFSLESDQTLALNVFSANDSAFTTSWVPLQAFYQDSLAAEMLGNPIIRPFPGGNLIPYISLELWQKDAEAAQPCKPPQSEQFDLVRLDFANDIIWLEKSFSQFYDRLIMGH